MNVTTPIQNTRTDLAIERLNFAAAETVSRIDQKQSIEHGVLVTQIVVPDGDSLSVGEHESKMFPSSYYCFIIYYL